MTQASEEVREFLRAAGRKGGKAKSARKQAASRANGKLSQIPADLRPGCGCIPQRPAVLIPQPKEGQ
jgi:hypothetical protein